MLKKVEQFIDKWDMLSEKDCVIVGVSGGADSVALFLILNSLRARRNFTIHVVHVNHGIRGSQADADEAYVQKLCEELGVPVSSVRADVPLYAKEHKISEEEAGREVRRSAFQDALKQYGGTKIALAHHQEDNAETFFLNLARGSRLKGLGGIYPVKGEYIRPLLCVGRKEIEQYLKEKNISYCMDLTNLEDTYMRNRVRNHVIPYFQEQINEKTVEHMNATMKYLRDVQEYLDTEKERAYEAIVEHQTEGVLLRETPFRENAELIRNMVIRRVLAEVGGKEKDLEEVHVFAVAELLEKQTGKKLDLPYGMQAKRSYEGIVVAISKYEEQTLPELRVVLEDGAKWEYAGKHFLCKVFPRPEGDVIVPKKSFTKWFDYDIMERNISIRTRKPGDRIVIDAEGHSKKLKSYYVDEKISSEERDRIPVMADADEIMWVIGYRQSKKYQITEETKTIVEIVVDGGK